MIPALIGLAGSSLVKTLVDRVLFFLALKALLITLFIIVAPIVINNFIHSMMEQGLAMIDASGVSGFDGFLELSGLAAWLAEVCRVPEVISVMTSAMQIHLVLRLLPFSPVRK